MEETWLDTIEHICDTCWHFGGCCCDHIDENGNCLGWEVPQYRTPAEQLKYDRFVRTTAFKMKYGLPMNDKEKLYFWELMKERAF